MNDKAKQFLKDALVILGMAISIFGTAILCLMIGFDEGRSYGEYAANDKLQNCQKLISENR